MTTKRTRALMLKRENRRTVRQSEYRSTRQELAEVCEHIGIPARLLFKGYNITIH
jgi:hypothetical protein